jgi:hypothetical protein
MAVHNNGEPKPHPLGTDSYDDRYEGSTTLYAKHLVEDHGVPYKYVEKYDGGMDQSSWSALNTIHRKVRSLD